MLAAVRIQRFDAWHLLVFRSRESPQDTISHLSLRQGQENRSFKVPERYFTQLQISAKNVPKAEKSSKLYFPKAESIRKITGGHFQDEAAYAKQWIASLSAETVCACSDGSSCGPARSAWGYNLYRGGQVIGSDSGPLIGAEVYDAEIFGDQHSPRRNLGKSRRLPNKGAPRQLHNCKSSKNRPN